MMHVVAFVAYFEFIDFRFSEVLKCKKCNGVRRVCEFKTSVFNPNKNFTGSHKSNELF